MVGLLVVGSVASALGACRFEAQGVGGEPGAGDGGPSDAADPPPVPDAHADADSDATMALRVCDDTDPDLVACYAFEDPKALLDDGSMYGNNGVATGVTSVAGPPGHGQAIGIGASSVTLVPDSVSLDVTQAVTLEMWVQPRLLPPAAGRAGLLDNNSQYALFLSPNGQVRCAVGSTVSIALELEVDTWAHIACTYEGTVVTMYQDGVLRDTTATTVAINTAGIDGMTVGQNSPSGDLLEGAIDDVRVWRVARTAGDICLAAGRLDCVP